LAVVSGRRAELHLHRRDAIVLGALAVLFLLATDWAFNGVAELVSGVVVVVAFVIAMRVAAVRGGRRTPTATRPEALTTQRGNARHR
jgi:hypothetical protein